MRKKILVTGGAGYVGSMLLHELLERRPNDQIVTIDKGVFGFDGVPSGVKIYNSDIAQLDRDTFESILGDTHTIIHLAGISTEPTAQINPRITDLVNHVMTVELAKKAKLLGVPRFIFASSASVYFNYDTPLDPPLAEEGDKVNPISAYALSKRASELGLLEMADNTFIPIIFRCGTVYGPSYRQRLDLVLNSFVKNAIFNKKIYVHCNGQIYRPMIDIHDLVKAYDKAIDMPTSYVSYGAPLVYNANSSNWNLLELANLVKKILEPKGVKAEVVIEPTGIARNYMANNELFKITFFNQFLDVTDSIKILYDHISAIPHPEDEIYYNDKVYMKRGL